MIIVFLSLMILCSLFRGYKEGMVMSRTGDEAHTGLIEGIRGHKYFFMYHNISLLGDFLLLFTGITLCYIEIGLSVLFLILGFLFLCWGIFEVSYSYARYESIIPPTENILGTGVYATGDKVVLLFILRLVISFLLFCLSFIL